MKHLQQKLNKNQWLQLFGLAAAISLFLQLIAIPLIRWGGDQLLLAGENPIVSISSGVRLVQQRPLVALGILVELAIIALMVDCLSIVWVAGVDFISREIEGKSWLPKLGRVIKEHWISAFWPALLMFLAFLPLFSLCFRTPLLVAGRAPIVFLDYLTRNRIVVAVGGVLYLLVLYLAWRFKRALCLIVTEQRTLKQALKQLRQSPSHSWSDLKGLLLAAAVTWLVNGLGLLCLQPINQQVQLETVVLVIVNTVASIALVVLLVNWQLANTTVSVDKTELSSLALVLPLLWLGLIAVNDYRYVATSVQPRHVAMISHRGVVDKNGVQNTIPALQRTHRYYHPDLVEIDIHETKDHRWIVMHDENYKKLTGVNKLPRQLTLKQGTKLVAKENGHQAHVASFDQYLAAAEKAHQRLLVEIKTTGHESTDYLQQFNRKYRRRFLRDHDLVQSMDYDLVRKEKRLAPGLKPVYIQAYDVGGPSKTVGGINIEYSGINQHFVWQTHQQGQVLYGWTVNNAHVADQLSRQGVDGIVTDRVVQMKRAVIYSQRHRQSWRQLWSIINPLSDWSNWQNLASK